MTESLKSAPCTSCGGGASCGCSSAACKGCASCQGGPLQRPSFFAGQLLTEDDLQLLSEYVANKSRLHNRFLHGDGVVCGLLVMCHPCGGGKVVVQSGTALDCCGNQIIVPCPVELNINEMVRTLRIEKRGGYDCGDPCKELEDRKCDSASKDARRGARLDSRRDTNSHSSSDTKGGDIRHDSDDDTRPQARGRPYCLYLKYCETSEEPVAPYVTGDCAVQVCKPTRIREGYEFELRCAEDEPPHDDVWQRIRCCIGDLTRADKAAQDANSAKLHYSRTSAVLPLVRAGRVPELVDDDVELLRVGIDELGQLQPSDRRRGAIESAAGKEPDEQQVRRWLDTFQSTAAAVIRYDLQPEQTLRTSPAGQKASELIDRARTAVSDSGPTLRTLAMAKLPETRDRLIADTWISQGLQWSAEGLAPEQRSNEQRLMYAYNAPHSTQLQRQFSRDLNDFRDWLLDRIERKGVLTDCRLLRDLLAIEIPSDALSRRDARAIVQLYYVLIRYLLDCICTALNPPCQPCEDSAVKLACLSVEDCEVIDICNLERKFVLSGPAFRYWVPFLHGIGELFEQLCCDKSWLDLPEPRPQPVDPGPGTPFERKQMFMAQTAPTYAHVEDVPELSALFNFVGIDNRTLRSAVNFGGNMVKLTGVEEALSGAAFAFTRRDVGGRVTDAAVNAVIERPHLRAALIGGVEKDVAELRKRVDATQPGEDLMQAVNSKVEQMLADAGKTSAKTTKELRAALAEQDKRNDQLEKRLAKLEKGA